MHDFQARGAVIHGRDWACGRIRPGNRDGIWSDLRAQPDASLAQGIHVEYSHVPLQQYRAGRGSFIERLLASPRIFLSDDFHPRLDRQARINLRGVLSV
jgi:hypothetical protein